ncbi:MAG: glycosyl-4,4'-diaponeurosporenoate acyltransferase [Verrucomicrobiales bacterium]|jgi:glycosyl-4,4'-diaponeurosporenoate acyltransferase
MFVELPNLWILIVNLVAVPVIHLSVSWWFMGMPRDCFKVGGALFRERGWERSGAIYQKLFRIRVWKHLLPDAAPWFDGFPKKQLNGKDPGYLRDFIAETCRSEAAHHVQILFLLGALIWNPWPAAAGVMIGYAVLSNLPCILLQRYNRIRMSRVLERLAS